ncbi:MAG: STAS domain-containing protein [Bosea sp.]|uniref:STAS domain-containing protein n=1 Tax=Bosea sp. (in: a-proteobacteria) TaxID=1871050 RepID=UPI00239E3795|nr:STAS domain-containing protein [Bosea sp. (in: a-proteobacteria)]MCP4737560.1 STAS domain-containing protein [Bosea sp. (in: a-proteobacteria)]
MMESQTIGEMRVLSLTGRLDSINAAETEAAIVAEIRDGATRLVLDCSGLTYVSSAGLRVFLVVAKRMREIAGKVVLAGLTPSVKEVFAISGFLQILTVCETREDAIAMCEQGGSR